MIWKLLGIGGSSLIKWTRHPKKVNKVEREENQNSQPPRWSPWSQWAGIHTWVVPLPHHTRVGRSNGVSLLSLEYRKLTVPSWALLSHSFSLGSLLAARLWAPVWQGPCAWQHHVNEWAWRQTCQPQPKLKMTTTPTTYSWDTSSWDSLSQNHPVHCSHSLPPKLWGNKFSNCC